jgi:hypothetical protein
MNIDITKKYTTRDGREVRVYAVDGIAPYNVHGAVKYENGWDDQTWTEDGEYNKDKPPCGRDLIPVKTWRAWKEGEAPKFFLARHKTSQEVQAIQDGTHSCRDIWFKYYTHVHEDGTETPCGVGE